MVSKRVEEPTTFLVLGLLTVNKFYLMQTTEVVQLPSSFKCVTTAYLPLQLLPLHYQLPHAQFGMECHPSTKVLLSKSTRSTIQPSCKNKSFLSVVPTLHL